jgi:hypothetical protein
VAELLVPLAALAVVRALEERLLDLVGALGSGRPQQRGDAGDVGVAMEVPL